MKLVALCALLVACSSGQSPTEAPPPRDLDLGTERHAVPVPDVAPVAVVDAPVEAAPVAVAPPAVPSEGVDFLADAVLLTRVAACGPGDLPPAFTSHAKIIDAHCKKLLERVEKFRAAYFVKARTWFETNVPADVPKQVVYAFGGGDLLSALVAFPDAQEITTISLEQAGDPRRISTLDGKALERSLGAIRAEIGGLLSVGSNTSENLQAQQRNDLPGQVSSFLIALVTGGYEPVGMKYFTLDPQGAVHYLTQAEIDAFDASGAKKLDKEWGSPNFSEAFVNVEISYRKVGEEGVRTHRHIAWNLGDEYMTAHPELVSHLTAKGKVTVLVKGASYLLWRGDFSKIRDYLLGNLAWMLSDSTGIPPVHAKRAGMVQVPYGRYHGAFLPGAQNTPTDLAFIELWAGSKHRGLGFRFGYVDRDKQAHVLVTKPK